MPVKLLFDENLSTRLPRLLSGVFPGSSHVDNLDLGGASDRLIWERAASNGFTLVSKDEDFQRLSVLLGPPPKVIWIRLGNCLTSDIVHLLDHHAERIESFTAHAYTSFLELG